MHEMLPLFRDHSFKPWQASFDSAVPQKFFSAKEPLTIFAFNKLLNDYQVDLPSILSG
jgi:hypothetical protein